MDYQEFLKSKREAAPSVGFEPVLPLNPMLFDWQQDIVRWAVRKGRSAIFADCGLGKGQPLNSNVLTPDGWREIGKLNVGDGVIGSDGKSYPVTGVYDRGLQDAYRFSFSDGSSLIVDDDHLWAVKDYNNKARKEGWQVRSTGQLRESTLKYGVSGQSRTWHIPLVEPVEFRRQKELVLHPYLLGVLLGDGHISGNTPSLSTADMEIVEYIDALLPSEYELIKRKSSKYDWNISCGSRNGHRANPVSVALRGLGLMGCKSESKFVPTEYLFAAVWERLELLRGLMDTDGYCGDTPEFCTISRQLAHGVVHIVQSLGGTARVGIKANPSYTHLGEKRTGQMAYRVTMTLPVGINPFRLFRKASVYKAASRGLGRWIDRIEFVGIVETRCISVASPDQLYVTENFIVTHNTPMQLEWSRHVHHHTNRDVLILAPLSVAQQTQREGQKFGIEVTVCRTQADIKTGINITNYEMLQHFDPSHFGGVVLDESGILKNYTGSIKRAILAAFRETRFKLCCTATPAPNDHLELGNHADFLDVITSAEMISRWFINDSMEAGCYRLKKHAEKDFWRWVAIWAVSLSKPSDLGYSDDGFGLPELRIHSEVVDVDLTVDTGGKLIRMPSMSSTSMHTEMRITAKDRAARVAELVAQEGGTWVIWCNTNYEADEICRAIPEAVEIRGSDSIPKKEDVLGRFASGAIDILVSKAKITGFGLNWQHCHQMAFCGLSYSFEALYQAIRRSWRFGQQNPVDVHIVMAETEGPVLEVIERKRRDHTTMQAEMVQAMSEVGLGTDRNMELKPTQCAVEAGHSYTVHLGDSCQTIREIPDNSIGLTITSPPFSNLYIYSDLEADLGNSDDQEEFFKHFKYLIPELLRVTMPGRLAVIHCKDLPLYKNRDGAMGLWDFPAEISRAFVDCGWTFHSRVTIWKCPVIEMQRTKNHGLLYKNLRADSCGSRQGMADYLMIFRKWSEGMEETEPVTHTHESFPLEQWQEWASPVWMSINQTDVLNGKIARTEEDEKHICPLQLDLIHRCLVLWSNPGDVVLDPFSGVGSVGYQAVKHGRRHVGIELKPAYWQQSVKFLRAAEAERFGQRTLFDMAAV